MEDVLEKILNKLEAIDNRLMKVELTQENVVCRKIDLLAEGQQGMNEQLQKLDQLSKDMEEVKIKVSAVERVTKDHTSQISELRVAK